MKPPPGIGGSTAGAGRRIVPPPGPRPPDNLVDPNLLPPPPPKPKPKPTTVVVVCALCGTRMDVPLAKVGYTVQCPDCHIVNEVKPPPAPKPSAAKVPTLEEAETFQLSDPGERPAYRPLQEPRGDYKVLAALDSPSAARPAEAAGTAPTATADADDDEVRLEAPVERVELAPPPVKLPDPDPEDTLYDGRYDDAIAPADLDPAAPEAWKKAPFFVGVAGFPFYPSAIARWIMYAAGGALILTTAHTAIACLANPAPETQFASIALCAFLALSLGLWTPGLASCLLAIIQDTANGNDDIENWPDWDLGNWFLGGTYVIAAGILTGGPGLALGTLLVASGLPPIVLAVPVVLSWVALFPIVIYSMLVEVSMMALLSGQTLKSFRAVPNAWLLVYFYSFVLGVAAIFFAALAGMGHWLASIAGAAGLVGLSFLYCRLLGRLLWYANEQIARLESE